MKIVTHRGSRGEVDARNEVDFEEIYRLKINRFSFVLIDRYFYDTEVFSVVVDNYKGAFDLTTHLTGRGRKRLAWVAGLKIIDQ